MDDLRTKLNQVGGDLFKDLRDRRLLPVVGLLVVAIIAVPFLVGGGGEEELSPAPIAASTAEGAEQLDAVVLAGSSGVRDFRKRLNGDPRNPFKQQYPGAKQSGGDGADDGGSTGSTSESPSGTTLDPTAGGTSSTDVPPATAPSTPPATPDEPEKPKRITRTIRMTIDVRISHSGKKRDIEGVEPLSLVPGDKTPIVQFTGAAYDAKQAGFVISPSVADTWGDGNCDPGRNDCQFLTLEPGQSQYFHYGEKAKRYRLKLLAINREVIEEIEKVAGAKAGKSAEVG